MPRRGITGYKKCLKCEFIFPYRDTLKVRANGKIRSVNTKYCGKPCLIKATIERNKMWNPSPEWRKMMGEISRKRMKGVPISMERRAKMSQSALRGDKSPLWRGGRSTKNALLRHSFQYSVWRKSVFERDDYSCQFCGKRGGKLNADHIKPFALFPDLRFELTNGRTLCEPCHRGTETWGRKTAKIIYLLK